MSKSNPLPAYLAAVLMTTASAAHSDEGEQSSVQRAVDYRESYMTVLGWNARPMGRMLKGEEPFDEAAFVRHAQDLARAAQLDLLAGFPEDSATDESDAKDEIWFTWDDFTQKFADFQAAAKTLGETAAGSDVEAVKAAFGDVGEACKACHKQYKE